MALNAACIFTARFLLAAGVSLEPENVPVPTGLEDEGG